MRHFQPLVFLGASTAFAEISELIRDINRVEERYEVVALLDDNSQLHGQSFGGVPVVGALELVHNYPTAKFVFGIGSFRTRSVRLEIVKRLNLPEDRYVSLIHPNAKVYSSATVGAGSIIHSGVVIGNDVDVAPFAIVTFNSAIGPRCVIGRGAMVTTLVTVLSGAVIGPCAFIGAGSCIAEGITIGPGAMVGMASAVFRDVAPGTFVLGNPARVVTNLHLSCDLSQPADRTMPYNEAGEGVSE
jgi:sugar O-acyltransferase (sialic acid O-acetyltransferase NeuD family)